MECKCTFEVNVVIVRDISIRKNGPTSRSTIHRSANYRQHWRLGNEQGNGPKKTPSHAMLLGRQIEYQSSEGLKPAKEE